MEKETRALFERWLSWQKDEIDTLNEGKKMVVMIRGVPLQEMTKEELMALVEYLHVENERLKRTKTALEIESMNNLCRRG